MPVLSPSATRHEKTVKHILGEITNGHLTLRDPDGSEHVFGRKGTEPSACFHVRDRNLYSRLLENASLGLGEGYMDGSWDAEHDRIIDVAGILLLNNLGARVRSNPAIAMRCISHRALHRPTSIGKSRKNAEYHYDLGNGFYELFLDPTMTYSCGYMQKQSDTLETMQKQKYDLISRKLSLSPGDTLIDIGCGWGGMLIHAARKYGISGVGITLSRQQQEYAASKIKEEGLSGRLEVRLQDYRELQGEFDKCVSIGMFEHVGKSNYTAFMDKVRSVLKPGGLGLLHTIGTNDMLHSEIDPWIERYIFPGAHLPRLSEIVAEMNRTGLTIGHIENLKPHYAITLRHWKKNLDANRGKIQSLDARFDERFMRMWNFYLQACEAGFRYGSLQLYQVLFHKNPRWTFTFP